MRACSGVAIPAWWTPWNGSVAPDAEVAAPAAVRRRRRRRRRPPRWPGRSRPAAGAATGPPDDGRSRRGPRRPVGGEPGVEAGQGGGGGVELARQGEPGGGRTRRCPGSSAAGPATPRRPGSSAKSAGDGGGQAGGHQPPQRRDVAQRPVRRRRRWRPRRPVRGGRRAPGSTAGRRPPPSRAGRRPPTRWPRGRAADGTGGTGPPAPGAASADTSVAAGPPDHRSRSTACRPPKVSPGATSVSSSSSAEALTELPRSRSRKAS